jgi:hypothetical protein
MARRFHELIAAGLLATAGISTNLPAQEPNAPVPPNPPPRNGERFDRKDENPPRKRLDDFEQARRVFDQLPPEQRQRFRENLERWSKLPPEERDVLRKNAEVRGAKIARDIDEAIRKAGLQLDPDRRQVFALRYAQERRKIEEQLRKEMEEKRQPMMRDMIERLKNEFKNASASSPSLSPSPTASPTAKP